jgi:hypothetical protein
MGGTGYVAAHRYLSDVLQRAWPGASGLHKAVGVAAVGAFCADVFWARRAARVPEEPSRADDLGRWAQMLRAEADRAAGPTAEAAAVAVAAPVQNVNVHITAPGGAASAGLAASAGSRYLQEEGATADTDCFRCATAHLAGMEGALRRGARVAERGGTCDDECQRWLHLAAQEPSALFARDWTPAKHATLPPEQRAVVDAFEPRIRSVQRDLLGGAPALEQREALVDGAVLLKESTRFLAAGDGLDHPEVQPRLADAVSDLTAGERLEVGVFPDALAARLRRVRQAASRPESPDQVVEAARAADEVSLEVNRQAFGRKSPEELRALADQVRRLRDDFHQALRRQGPGAVGPDTAALAGPIRTRPGDVHVPRHVVDRFSEPSEATVAAVTSREDVGQAYDRVEAAVESRGTRVRYRNLPTTFEGTLFGQYDHTTDVMLLDDFARTAKDPFAFQVLSHEAVHALVDGPRCHDRLNYVPSVPYLEQPAEVVAQTGSLAAMLALGMPVELADGTELPPGRRQVNWRKVEADLGPGLAADTRWAADWIARAARGEDGALAAERCPAVRGVA